MRYELEAHAWAAFMAGRYFVYRMHWLSEARSAKDRGEKAMVEMYVSLARNSHRSYLKDMHRAVRLQRSFARLRSRPPVRSRCHA